MPADQLLRSTEFRDAGYWGDDTLPAVIDSPTTRPATPCQSPRRRTTRI